MNSRDIAFDIFQRLGCHPEALKACQDREPSYTVWLLAAALCRGWCEGLSWEAVTQLRAPKVERPYFVSLPDEWPQSQEARRELIEMDCKALVAWLKLARDQWNEVRNRVLVDVLAQLSTAEPDDAVSLMPRRTLAQAQAMGRSR